MDDRAPAPEDQPPHSADRRRLGRLLLGAALSLPGLAIAGCAENPRPDWKPNWQRGPRGGGGSSHGPGRGGGRSP